MQYLTVKEYAALKGISRQAVEDRIRRGTLPVTFINMKVKAKRIPVEDTEAENVK